MRAERGAGQKRRLVLRAVSAAGVAILLAAIALINAFLPFRSLLPAYALPARREGELRLHFLDVGQGDCTIAEFPDGEVLVIDAGDGSWENDNKLVRYLKALSPASLTLLSTHADGDHCGGFATVLSLFGVDRVYLPALPADTARYRAFAAGAARSGAEVSVIKRYDRIVNASGAYAVCISPYSAGETDENEASAVLYLRYAGVSALLCGDVTAAREARLIAEYALDETLFDSGGYAVRLDETDILKAAHHGSADSSSAEWLSLLDAETAIVSCGRGNGYAHPSGGAIARLRESGAEVYRTDESGDLMITISDGSYSVLQRSKI